MKRNKLFQVIVVSSFSKEVNFDLMINLVCNLFRPDTVTATKSSVTKVIH